MNILVTGATGFIGSHLCKELIRREYQVFGLSRSGRKDNIKSLLSQEGFHLLISDIQDTSMLQTIIRENHIKVVFHLIAYLRNNESIVTPFSYFDVNARGTLNMLNAAYLNGVEKFIYASTMKVYSEPPEYLPVDEKHPAQPSTVYGATKLAGELCCHLYSQAMSIIILRISGAFGVGERKNSVTFRFIDQALSNRPITIYGDGKQTTDFVFIDDVIQGTLFAWEKATPGVYNIGSGQETSVRELAQQLINITNSKSEIVLSGEDTERPFRFFLDVTKAQKVFGYSPRLLDRGLRLYLEKLKVEV